MLFMMTCVVWIGPAMAHRVVIFAWVEGDRVFTESKFSGGKRVKQGDVIVYDSEGNQLLKGKTDDKGEFSFEVPKKTSLKIVLMAGMGHGGEWTIPVSELEDVAGPPIKTTPSQKAAPKKTEKQAEGSHLSSNEIRLTVEEALDKKLKPVMKILVELRESRPTFRDIFGGIGYILGLVGVAAYFNYRRKSAEIDGKKAD
jgi:nickel transport protein